MLPLPRPALCYGILDILHSRPFPQLISVTMRAGPVTKLVLDCTLQTLTLLLIGCSIPLSLKLGILTVKKKKLKR